MSRPTLIRPVAIDLYLLPIATRMPLKFGAETLTEVTCARVRMELADERGQRAIGWGETPLSIQWVWPSSISFAERYHALVAFCHGLVDRWIEACEAIGEDHPITLGHRLLEEMLPEAHRQFHAEHRSDAEPMPWLAALVGHSAFDLAMHDAYGHLVGRPIYYLYGREFLKRDLSAFLEPAEGSSISFQGRTLDQFLSKSPPDRLPAWHLVGGKDPLDDQDLDGAEPDDGYPVTLHQWIERDGLNCLKVKLRGDDPEWDWDRIQRIGRIADQRNVRWLSTDFNCMVKDPAYVTEILDRLLIDQPETYAKLLYVEQPFPYDLEANRIDTRAVSARKPLFLDESAHDWRLVRLGRDLGWSGVALKTCKTQTGALLAMCWAKEHGMPLMVQDLTNPMLAQVPHVQLAAHAGTIQGVETNGMQFYPEASVIEAKVHPGLYRRCEGQLDRSTLGGPGFGYRVEEIARTLPEPVKSRMIEP